MKQTNNAIKFLMAQYRAIFKNAYFKGMATALVLTAGLAAGQAQADDGKFWQYSGSGSPNKWTQSTTQPAGNGALNSTYTIAAGIIAGENRIDAPVNVTASSTASSGSLIIADSTEEHYDFTTMSGTAAGGWAEVDDGDAYATGNKVLVNNGGKVSALSTGSNRKGEIYGGRASSTNGRAEANNNIVTIDKDTNAGQFAAETGIFGGTAKAGAGATAAGNQVIINKDNNATAQVMSNVTKDANQSRIVGGWVEAQSPTDSSGVFVARNNLVDIYNLSYTGAATDKGGYIGGGYVKLTKNDRKADTLHSENNQVILVNSIIDNSASTSNFSIFGEHATTAADGTAASVNTVSVAGDGSKANLSITNSTLKNVEVFAGLATNKGSTNASGLVVNLDATELTGNKKVWGGHADSQFVAGNAIDAIANNNTVKITNADAEKVKIVNNQIFGGIASITAATAGKDFSQVTLTATGNKVNIDGNLKFTTATGEYYIAGAKAAQVSGSGATVTLSNNSVNFNATANGPADSSGSIVGALVEGISGDKKTKISVLNNTVTIGANAEVTNMNIVAAKLASGSSTTEGLIHSGNTAIVQGYYNVNENDQIYSIQGDDVQITDNAVVYVQNGILNISGLEDASGKYFNGTGTVDSSARVIVGTNENDEGLNIYNALTFEGDNSLIATTTGAVVTVDAGKHATEGVTDKPAAVTNTRATLGISEQGLVNFLTKTENQTHTIKEGVTHNDAAGALKVVSGGAVDFLGNATLSNFDFTKTDPSAGKIMVDSAANSGSIFRADEMTVAHMLATNTAQASGDHTKLEALDTTDGIQIEANTLNLGATGLSSTRSESIKFGKAIVRDEINFLAATSGNDINDKGTQVGINVHNDGFHLTSEVVGSHYMLTNSQDGKLQYYTAQNGVVNGTVTLQADTKDSGNLIIKNGNWTAHDQITVADGGTLNVGGLDGEDGIDNKPANVTTNSPDATLVLDQALVLDVAEANTSGGATVSVSGDSSSTFFVADYTDALDSTIAAPTDRVALLDLRNGLTLDRATDTSPANDGGIKGKATISVTDKGIVLLKADDVNTILAQNDSVAEANQANSGAFFEASDSGAFIVEGDMFTDFGDFSTTNNGIDLGTSGVLVTDTLTVEHENDDSAGSEHNDKAYIDKADSVSFGGSVYVGDLAINDLQLTNGGTDGKDKPANAGNYASQVVVADGDVHVSKSLTSYNQTLVLGQDDSKAAFTFATDAVGDAGTIAIDNLRVDNGSLTFENGTWTAKAIDLNAESTSLIVGSAIYEDINGADSAATLNVDTLTMSGGSSADIKANGTANIKSADFSELDAAAADATSAVTVAGTLNITDNVKFGGEGSISIAKNGILAFSGTATNAAIVKDGNYTSTNATVLTSANSGTFTKIRNEGGELQLGLASTTVFGKDQIRQLKADLFTSDSFEGSTLEDRVLKNGGVLNIGDASFNGVNVNKLEGEGLSGYYASWDDLKSFSDTYGNDVTSNELKQTNVQGIEPGDNIQGNWGSLSMIDALAPSAQVEIAGNTKLTFAEGNNGFFISDADHKIALGAIIQGQKDLTLVNGGTIGKITMEAGNDDADKNLTILNVVGPNQTIIDSIVGEVGQSDDHAKATAVRIQGGETVVNNDITAIDEVEVHEGASLNVKGDADINNLSTFNANAKFDKTLTVQDGEILGGTTEALDVVFESAGNVIDGRDFDSLDVANGGTLKADTFTFKNDPTVNNGNGVLMVGYDLTEAESTLENGTKITGTGYLEISNYLDLNGGTLVVDPAYGEATSVAAVMNFKDAADSDKSYETVLNDVGIVNGSALIGKNAALGIGATLAETQEAIAKYQTNGSLSEEDYGSILYLNGQVTLAHGSEIALNSASTVRGVENIRDTLKYNLVAGDSENLREDQLADLGLGANTAILMTENAFISDDNGNKKGVAITFDRTNAVVNGQGGDIVLIGSFDAKDPLNFFMDKDGEGHQGALIAGQDINVYTQNGFLYTVLKAGTEAGYGEQLKVDTDRAYAVMNEASNPVVETLISYHVDRGGAVAGDTPADSNDSGSSSLGGAEKEPLTPLQDQQSTANAQNTRSGPNVTVGNGEINTPPTEDNGNNPPANDTNNNGNNNQQTATTRVTGSSDFLNEVVTTSHGAPAEAAARLAIYGGAVQAAMAATSSTTDAIAARMGVGNTANITMANNGQGAALWLAPVYKTHDSDSFDSQGLDYGVDLNLYGVALGADFEFMPGLTAGIMFNVGSGDADGQGNAAANNTSNDFDYWGAALYGNYTYDALSVTADVSYTAVDNDLEATTGMDQFTKLESSTDTTAISLGVTAKYTFDLAGVEVAPHAGLRYTNIDLDDYSIKSNGESIADYSADKVNIFSIPVGVTFAKEFTGDAWTVKPSLDLTLTGNFGDDDISGDVSWTGVDGLVTPVSSEYMDDFTYGATLGIEAASTGGFSLGLGVNYTGSSNVDEFGVNANARFVF